jgi:DNA-binding XRE family transcriptional regulator
MAASLLKYANREAVAQALTERGYSVSRATVNRWARGKEMPDIAARMIAELFQHPTTETAPPEWARRLAQDTALSVIEALAPPEVQRAAAAVIARLEGTQPPTDEVPLGSGEEQDQDGLVQPEPGRG